MYLFAFVRLVSWRPPSCPESVASLATTSFAFGEVVPIPTFPPLVIAIVGVKLFPNQILLPPRIPRSDADPPVNIPLAFPT